MNSLTESSFNLGVKELTQSDPDLAAIIDRFGIPNRWQRKPGFATLLRIILEQQVSLAAAKATFTRLCNYVNPLTPENFLGLEIDRLKQFGFSRQKITYTRELAQAIVNQEINLAELAQLDDITIKNQLKTIKGIGDWTADNYILMALQRPDVFPKGDLAIAVAVQKIKQLSTRPQPKELENIAELWRPWRSVATQILWHYYLNC